jgi:hypothetical protein
MTNTLLQSQIRGFAVENKETKKQLEKDLQKQNFDNS